LTAIDGSRVAATPELGGETAERGVSPVELLWDLVFVFAITQVGALLARDLTWSGLGHAALLLALVWWAWSAYVWVANSLDVDSLALQLTLVTGLVLVGVNGLAIPSAFGAQGALFAATYVAVRLMHLGLYAASARQGNASWEAIAGFASTVVIGMVLLLVGSLLPGAARVGLWTAAAVIDYAGPLLTRRRLRGLQHVAVAHFAERYGAFIIICLGESVAAIGVTASRLAITPGLVAVVALGLVVTVCLWWEYFRDEAGAAAARLREHAEPVLAGSDAYSYLHLVLVAGIILFAVGMRHVLVDAALGNAVPFYEEHLSDGARAACCGGLALFLAGDLAVGARLLGMVRYRALVAAGALLVVLAISGTWPGWAVVAASAAILVALCVAGELLRARESGGTA